MAILEVHHIEKHFGATRVLEDISFDLEQGQALAIIGSSGSGKTTLLRCLNFLEKPEQGTISVAGNLIFDAADPATQRESEVRKKRLHFGLVFQSFNLFNNMTVLENCMVGPIKVLGVSKDLKALQRKFAAQAEASARQMVKKQADQAGEQGKLVSQANLLHKAGATTESRATMLWRGALDALRLPAERISSRWLGTEALMLASAPYKSTKDLVEDLQLATVKRLMPNVDRLSDDEALANAVLDVREVYEDTVYQVAHDVIAVLKAYAEVDKATGGKADLPMLSVLQSIRDHIATLVYPGFIGRTPPDALKSLSRYLRADLSRLNKAKTDKNRDVKWAWQADEARQVVDKALARAKAEPAGPKHEALMKQAEQARWMLEEFYVSLWAQELGTKGPASLNRIKKALA